MIAQLTVICLSLQDDCYCWGTIKHTRLVVIDMPWHSLAVQIMLPNLPLPQRGSSTYLRKKVPADSFRVLHASATPLRCTPCLCTTLHFKGYVLAKQFYYLVKDKVCAVTCSTQAMESSNLAACLCKSWGPA